MTTDAALLLQQWLSPAFPIGAFAYSHGIEAAVEAGWITDTASLHIWLSDLLEFGAGRSDALFIAAAYRAQTPAEWAVLDAQALAFQPSRERLFEMTQQGEAFVRTLDEVWEITLDLRAYPVVFGAAVAAKDLPLETATTLYLQAFCSNLIASAQRLLPVGQTQGQRLLMQLAPQIQAAAKQGLDGDLQQLASVGFLSDIAAMKHETQYSRIFRS
ncbi:urease accessory protein UreF [Epibacterium ulvae]|uniref:urease accessory protein UreF n=1 Tax=Epibacterium ulvae TaxID=1156985 RepID=UPI001BFC3C81|nr:urease accessory protein UreF [Epibacterium ulvae]MBT8153194.1 urease accessory protein UreF [Epibacterium ulvae]